ncbi:MAG: GGDEF domain-containing protein [Zoogloeaceae bacterium]|jgi:diguanylate cyclase (GGDEF)-like protein|nr:GGDEF domain-containing protein [Zoogloeaceae bacterium]
MNIKKIEKQPIQERKINRSVGRRLTVLIVFMIVALSIIMTIIGYIRFKESTEEYYFRMGETVAGIVARIVNADTMDRYFETAIVDEEYDKIINMLRETKDKCKAKVLYVFLVKDNGIHYIYDTDDTSETQRLGEFDPFVQIDPDTGKVQRLYPEATEKQLHEGGKVDTIMGMTQYGWTITINEPIYGSDGRAKGYVGIDFDVNNVIAENAAYLWQSAAIILIITAIFSAIYLYAIHKAIVRPINMMAKAADSFLANSLESGEKEISIESIDIFILSMEINTRDEMQSLAESLKSMVLKIHEYIVNLNLATIKSETDALTSLFNRGAFEQRVSAILRLRSENDQTNAFMMIDVDYFKAINDNYGHAAGDMVLSECAQALLRVMRKADVVGRLGGDEFAVFCKNIGSVAMAEDKARQIRQEWLKIIPPGGEKGVTASIGISFAPQDGQEYQELFARADAALYKVKEAGRDGFVISSV